MSSVVETHDLEVLDPTLTDVAPHRARRRWSVDEYHRMGELGVLGDHERLELIEGDIIKMAPIGSRHASQVNRLNWVLNQNLNRAGLAIVAPQNPVVLDEYSEPEPDIAVLRWRDDFYQSAHPGPNNVLLMIEVSDSTVKADRQVKAPLYARHGIPEYWIVDITAQRLEVYREPMEGHYQQTTEHQAGTVSPVMLPEVVIDLVALFPADD
ncbi:MAG: Uma2 family endonuclease [Candidatus Competibacteraceae bacterium]|jgi:Uma2 family endonuclease|nr:Uma2 family endonuclease [Candidatus Competibacteraceae bacterium]